MTERWLSVKEIAAHLGVSRNYIQLDQRRTFPIKSADFGSLKQVKLMSFYKCRKIYITVIKVKKCFHEYQELANFIWSVADLLREITNNLITGDHSSIYHSTSS